MSLSIRWRLTIWIAAAILLSLTAVFLTLQFALDSVLSSDLDGDLSRDLGQVSAQMAIAGSPEEADLQEIVESHSYIVVIRDPNGNALSATPEVDADSLALDERELAQVVGGTVLNRTLDVKGEETRIRTARLVVGREVVGIVQVGESAAAISRAMEVLRLVFLGVGLAAAALALGVGYWLARSALKPIDDVAHLATEIEASDLNRRTEVRSKPSEVQRLADTFDAMLERLSVAFLQQRNFVMDVSHELRTPLTALRGQLDVLLMNDRLQGDARDQLERMSAEVARLIRLTSNLLYLAHADAGREIARRPVELDTLCLEVYRQAKDVRPEVNLRLGHEDQVTLQGDRDLLKQLVLNLVDNGLKYAPAGGEVSLSIYRDADHGRLVVKDSGPGIAADQIPHIFERFYRGSNSRDRVGGGAGIGLSISRWIAQAHGGDIQVESEVGRGSVFTVVLPLKQKAATGEAEE